MEKQTDNQPEVLDNSIVNDKGHVIYTFEKFSKEQWESIEKPVDPTTQKVLNLLVSNGSSNSSLVLEQSTEARLRSCGEDAYLLTVRPYLEKYGYLTKLQSNSKDTKAKAKPKAKAKAKSLKAEDRIRLENFNKTLKRETSELFEVLDNSGETGLNYGLKLDIIELRFVTLYMMGVFYLKKLEKDNKSTDNEEMYILIQSIQLVLENIEEYKFISALNPQNRISPSSTLIEDLTWVNGCLKQLIKYRVSNIFQQYPQLTDPSRYYQVLPELSVKLNSCQSRLIKLSQENSSYLIFYASNFGSGKTTATIGITATVLNKRDNIVIYCCMSEAVRHNLAKYAYNASIPFALAVTVNQHQVRIINNNNCRTPDQRRLIITDYLTALELVKNSQIHLPNQNREKIILMIDEPTDGADYPNHFKTVVFARLFSYCPSRTILISATLPTIAQLQPYVDYFQSQWSASEPVYQTVQSNKVRIGCQLIDRSGCAFVCHQFCKNREHLNNLIGLLKSNQFLGRLYTAPIVYNLREKLVSAKVKDLPDLEEYFGQVRHLESNNIKDMAVKLLECLYSHTENLTSLTSDDLIVKICQTPVKVSSRYDLYGRENAEKMQTSLDYNCFKFEQLGTTDAYKFLGPTLLVTNNPLNAAISYFEQLLFKDDASKLIKHYLKNKEIEDKTFEKMEKSQAKDKSTKKRRDDDYDAACEERDKYGEQEERTESAEIKFSQSKQINTISHLKRYLPSNLNLDQFNFKKIRSNQHLTLLPFNANVIPELILRLFAGVGLLLSENDRNVDRDYTHNVIKQTLDGTLAYTVSDETIIFGVNSPADNLIVEDSAIENRSISTIFQLLARVGRPGLSWTATAYIGEKLKAILIGYLTNGENGCVPIDNESIHMNEILEGVLLEKTNQLNQTNQTARTNIFKPPPTKEKRPTLAKSGYHAAVISQQREREKAKSEATVKQAQAQAQAQAPKPKQFQPLDKEDKPYKRNDSRVSRWVDQQSGKPPSVLDRNCINMDYVEVKQPRQKQPFLSRNEMGQHSQRSYSQTTHLQQQHCNTDSNPNPKYRPPNKRFEQNPIQKIILSRDNMGKK